MLDSVVHSPAGASPLRPDRTFAPTGPELSGSGLSGSVRDGTKSKPHRYAVCKICRSADAQSLQAFHNSPQELSMGANRTVRVMLVEDHVAFREALALLLTNQSDLEVLAQAGSLAEAREALDGRLDVAVVDLGLPDGDGSELIGELRQTNSGISVVVLSAAMGLGYLDDVVKARADAVLDKVESIPTIVEEVRRLTGV